MKTMLLAFLSNFRSHAFQWFAKRCQMKKIFIPGSVFVYVILFVNIGMAENRLSIFVSIAPQKFFVQQIGKDLVDIRAMVPPGANPHTCEPKPKQMAGLSETQLYFATGVPIEKAWLQKISSANPKLKIIQTERSIASFTQRIIVHSFVK
jgi:zinc transport system substrate-binding protein